MPTPTSGIGGRSRLSPHGVLLFSGRRQVIRILARLAKIRRKSLGCGRSPVRLQTEFSRNSGSVDRPARSQSRDLVSQGTSPISSGQDLVRQKRYRKSTPRKLTGVLQPSLRSSEKRGGVASGNRSVKSKPFPHNSEVQNGDCRVYQSFPSPALLGSVDRSQRRVFSDFDPSVLSEVPPFYGGQFSVPIHCPPFWPINGPMGLYHGHEGDQGHGPPYWGDYPPVLRRLAPEGRQSTVPGFQTQSLLGFDGPTGSYGQLEQVGTASDPRFHFCGLQISHRPGYGVSVPRTDVQTHPSYQNIYPGPLPTGLSLVLPAGIDGCHGAFSSLRPSPHEGVTDLSQSTLVSVSGSQRDCGLDEGLSLRSTLVARSDEFITGVPNAPPSPGSPNFYGLVQDRLGGSYEHGHSFRLMVTPTVSTPHQFLGIESSISGTQPLASTVQTQMCPDSFGQFGLSGLYPEAGRYQVPSAIPAGSSDTPVRSESSYSYTGQTHTGEPQCIGGLPIPPGTDSSNRVVSVSQDPSTRVQGMGHTPHRPVRDSLEQQTPSVCVPSSGSSGLGSRCTVPRLGRNVGLRLPPSSHSSQDAAQDRPLPLLRHSNSAGLAQVPLVPRSAGALRGSSSSTTGSTQSAQAAEVPGLPQTTSGLQPSRLASVGRLLEGRGFSKAVASRIAGPQRESSLEVYEHKWRRFSAWCSERKEDPFSAPSPLVADFLLELRSVHGLMPSTCDGYRTAISNTIKHVSGNDLGKSSDLSALLHSFHQEVPRPRNPVPPWDLSVVLHAIAQAPFEPLETAPLKLLTYKTIFLTALASAKRRGELHAFAGVFSHKENWSSIVIDILPGFVPKSVLASKGRLVLEHVVIPALSPSLPPDHTDEKSLCPVRALRIYRERTRTILPESRRLWKPIRGSHKDIAPATISSWIKKAIVMALEIAQVEDVPYSKIKAHSVRAVASSLAFVKGVPLDQVLASCSWAAHNTFTSFYLRDLTLMKDGLCSLGSLSVAQHSV